MDRGEDVTLLSLDEHHVAPRQATCHVEFCTPTPCMVSPYRCSPVWHRGDGDSRRQVSTRRRTNHPDLHREGHAYSKTLRSSGDVTENPSAPRGTSSVFHGSCAKFQDQHLVDMMTTLSLPIGAMAPGKIYKRRLVDTQLFRPLPFPSTI